MANFFSSATSHHTRVTLPTHFDLLSDVLRLRHEHEGLPRKGPVTFSAHLCFERRTQTHGVHSIVRKIIVDPPGYADFLCSFTLDEALELNRDASAVLVTINEWTNSFVPINRLPLDVLFLISTYLPSQKDRFGVTFVCRHWRRTFVQNATLWAHLDFSKGEVCVKTLLERAKGSPLSILASGADPVGTVMLLPPHIKQITYLEFTNSCWADIQRFSDLDSGPLPLLCTLDIDVARGIDPNSSDVVISPLHPLFSGAVDLKKLRLHLEAPPFLSNFVFPNLTSFELWVASEEQFHGSQLLDFLEASPMLQVVDVKIVTDLSFEGIPRERVVVLQYVESLCLTMNNDDEPVYKLATHISCPSVKDTSLTHENFESPETFPASDASIRQYTRSPIEEVRLDLADPNYFIACSLTFRSADKTSITFSLKIDDDWGTPESFSDDVFHEAFEAIRDLPLLANVKRLYVRGLLISVGESTTRIACGFGGLLRSLGPLEELTLCRCDMRPWFFYYPEIVGYPPIKVLTLSDTWNTLKEDVAGGLVRLAKAQHELGMAFEHVTIRSDLPLADVGERLRPWIGVVDCAPYDRP